MKKVLFTFASLLIFILSAHAQDSLRHYLELALKNNPGVRQKFAEYNAALQKVPQVGSLPDPDVSVGVFLSPMEQLSGNQAADIRLMQMFPWFGVLKNAKDEMSQMARSKFEQLRDTKLQVGYDLQRSWYELQKVKQNLRIVQKNLSLLHLLEKLATVRVQSVSSGNPSAAQGTGMAKSTTGNSSAGSSGMNAMEGNARSAPAKASMPGNGMGATGGNSALTEVYKIQMEINDLQNNLESLHELWKTTTAQVNGLLNRAQNETVSVPDTLIAGEFHPTEKALADSTLQNNPMLGMLQFEGKSLDSRKEMVTRMGFPMVGLGINYSLINKSAMSTSTMNGKDMIMPMVTVTLPIYRKKYKSMQQEADLMKLANAQNIQATSNALQTECYQAMQAYQDARRRIRLYKSQFDLASKTTDILLKSFGAGETGLNDILRVRQQMFDYQYKMAEAAADVNIAIARMNRLGNLALQ